MEDAMGTGEARRVRIVARRGVQAFQDVPGFKVGGVWCQTRETAEAIRDAIRSGHGPCGDVVGELLVAEGRCVYGYALAYAIRRCEEEARAWEASADGDDGSADDVGGAHSIRWMAIACAYNLQDVDRFSPVAGRPLSATQRAEAEAGVNAWLDGDSSWMREAQRAFINRSAPERLRRERWTRVLVLA